MTGFRGFNMSNPIEVPDISQIDQWDRQREQAIQSLEISADELFVKCQRCGVAVRMANKGLGLSRSNGDRITILEQRLKRIESLHSKNKIHDNDFNSSIMEIKSELATLLKEEEIRDKLRRLPLIALKKGNL
jgi:hypothetical protein